MGFVENVMFPVLNARTQMWVVVDSANNVWTFPRDACSAMDVLDSANWPGRRRFCGKWEGQIGDDLLALAEQA